MKKYLTILLILMMMLVTGCRGSDSAPEEPDYYADLIFDTTRVHTVDVTMTEEDRADQLANPKEKAKYQADVVIDGEEIKDVKFHTKGNSSLYFMADAGKDKFSYEINFEKSPVGSFHGLNKLNLQNNYSDATALKEYMAFWLFDRMGVSAPLASHVWLTVNGEPQGLYTAIENMQTSFLDRAKGGKGTIYKPEAEGMALNDEELERLKAGGNAAHDSGGGADLAYKDDDEESYPDIFSNAETDEDAETRARVIRALKAVSERKDLDTYLDTEATIKYFAVHDYLVAYDSYTGPMLHNYCLYENDGKLAMLPWDYDLSFGSFPKDATIGAAVKSTEVVNEGIDSPLGVVPDEARPMWNWILCDENYLNEYHETISEVAEIIENGDFAREAARVREVILPYLEKDPKAYYTDDEKILAYETYIKISELRAESICRQLSGQLATRAELQADEDKVDASGINVKDMGSKEVLNR